MPSPPAKYLVGPAEAMRVLGVTSRASFKAMRERDGFPRPLVELTIGPVWDSRALKRWREMDLRRQDRLCECDGPHRALCPMLD